MTSSAPLLLDGLDPRCATAPVGGKARALHLLAAAGFPVPPFAVILPSDTLPSAPELLALATRLTANPAGLLAVRSSAGDEDGAEHSFAGQLESFLNIIPADVLARVAEVRASASSERVRAYRAERGLASHSTTLPAVILQRMVPAEAAGVAFSVDPVSGRRAHARVAAVRGLGEALVSGASDADTFTVDRSGAVVARTLAVDARAASSATPVLTDTQAVAIAALARHCEAHFGRAQDIEWALAGGELSLLQSRPVTTLARVADPDGALLIWDNSNIAESYCGVTTPLTYSFARYIYEEVYLQFCRLLGVPEKKLDENADLFGRMLGLVQGRIYYSLVDWYRAIALLPGFTWNRRFMEQMMGVKEEMPAELLPRVTAAGLGARLADLGHLGSTVLGLLRARRRLPRTKRAFRDRLAAALAAPAIPFSDQRADELAAAYRALERKLLTRWDAPMVNDFFAMLYHGVLRSLCTRWLGAESLANDLVGGEGGLVSTEPAERVEQLAILAAGSPTLRAALLAEDRAALQTALQSPLNETFAAAYADYLARFGDRCMEELKLESPTLRDDPTPLLRGISALLSRPADQPGRTRYDARAAAERRAAEALRGHPLRRFVFGRVLRRARVYVRDRENLRLDRTRLFARVRELFLALGRRFTELGALAAPRDVFFLTVPETLGFVEGTAVTTDLRALVALRRAEFSRFAAAPAPADRIETRGVVHVGNPFTAPRRVSTGASAGADQDPELRRGLPCCPGVVRARVRVVLDPRGVSPTPGEILVAARTDPGWVMLFPAAAGLLVEHGSLLSHSAIVSRELGLPSIVAIPGLTSWLRSGDLVEFDGAAGTVRRLEPTL
jgi:pyruvate,water dikinase